MGDRALQLLQRVLQLYNFSLSQVTLLASHNHDVLHCLDLLKLILKYTLVSIWIDGWQEASVSEVGTCWI